MLCLADGTEVKGGQVGDGLVRNSHLLSVVAERVLAEVAKVSAGLDSRKGDLESISDTALVKLHDAGERLSQQASKLEDASRTGAEQLDAGERA